MLEVKDVSFQYGKRNILHDVSFSVKKGELLGILGPNGSGKTTLFKLISGILTSAKGEVRIKNKNIHDYTSKELARTIAVLSQHSEQSFSYKVKEIVSLGRYAHQKNWIQTWSKEDEEMVQQAMEQTGVATFSESSIEELSGGEKQRVYLAQSLAQDPEILLLDEPTNHLDLSYQKELLDRLKEWSSEKGLTIICIFHDLNLASLYCDRLILLNNGKIENDSIPGKVLEEGRVNRVYKTMVKKSIHPSVSATQLMIAPKTTKVGNTILLDEKYLSFTSSHLSFQSPIPLKILSSGVTGAGVGWYRNFVNRHVDKSYQCDDYQKEMESYLLAKGFYPSETVSMMTAVYVEDAGFKLYHKDDFSVFIVATAGVSNAVDASKSMDHSSQMLPGTINTWIFISGKLSEQAYVQAVMTATEAKTSVLRDKQVIDPITGTLATGTSTDSILIAATQEGQLQEFAGTITPLGKVVATGVYECLVEALENRNSRLSL